MRPHRSLSRFLAIVVALIVAGGTNVPSQSPVVAKKRALIIAIGDYPAASGYPKIHVSRDVNLVQGALLTQGFDPGDIRVLRDSSATREGIIGAFDKLIEESQIGDAVVIHYSGHGHRISDDNGDELDGFDEILVPYGAPAAVRAGTYHGERHIRDDELGQILGRLREKLAAAGSVTVFLDACFSGSATRGIGEEAAARGIMDPIIVPGAPAPRKAGNDDGGGFLDKGPATRGMNDGQAPAPAAMVVMSAARHDQVAREAYDEQRNPVGSLSLALSRVMPRLETGATYRAMFDRIAGAMAEMNLGDQRPQIEGTVDARVLSGNVVAQQSFRRIARIESDSVVELAGGSLVGLLPGTRVALHARGTTDPAPAQAIATGTVSSATETRATVILEQRRDTTVLRDSWVFVTAYAYGDLRLRVGIDKSVPAPVAATLRAQLGGIPIVELVELKPDLRVGRIGTGAGARVGIYAADGGQVAGPFTPTDASFPHAIDSAVTTLARASYLRRLDLDSPKLRVRLELMRTKPRIALIRGQRSCSGAPPVALPEMRTSESTVLLPREEYALRLVNEGNDPAYVVVLDLQPNGKVSQIFPLPESMGSDNVLPAGKTYVIPDCYFAEEPYGLEILKLFATTERVDFAPVLAGTAGSTRGTTTNPLERLFAGVDAGTRGVVGAAAGAATTYSLPITIARQRPAAPH